MDVCPTYVGMNRVEHRHIEQKESMPHVCGDEPINQYEQEQEQAYAPRMWG